MPFQLILIVRLTAVVKECKDMRYRNITVTIRPLFFLGFGLVFLWFRDKTLYNEIIILMVAYNCTIIMYNVIILMDGLLNLYIKIIHA